MSVEVDIYYSYIYTYIYILLAATTNPKHTTIRLTLVRHSIPQQHNTTFFTAGHASCRTNTAVSFVLLGGPWSSHYDDSSLPTTPLFITGLFVHSWMVSHLFVQSRTTSYPAGMHHNQFRVTTTTTTQMVED
jgi:hypothetical protein